jgi:MoaA/NifB/PqqE/SkfB family radical SAM enzyme
MCNQWRKSAERELDTPNWKNIITDLKKNDIKNIHFTGGEPLLRKDLGNLISHASRDGFVTGFTTNGVLLTKEALSDFIDAGLRSIAISMDAIDAEYENIRGVPDSFGKLEKAVSIIAEAKRKGKIDAYINFTFMKNNMKELVPVKKFADEHGLPVAICLLDKTSFIFDLAKNRNDFWIKEDSDFEALQEILEFLKKEKIKKPRSLMTNFPAIDFIKEYFKDPLQARIPCVSSQDRIIIDTYGNLLGGCMSMGNFGNVKERSFSELRKEKKYRLAKKNMFYKNCPGCSCGYLFNIRCFPPIIVEDLLAKIRYR